MKLIIDILEEEYNECKMQVEMIKQEGFLIESLNTALKIHVANGQLIPEDAEILTKEAYSDLCLRASGIWDEIKPCMKPTAGGLGWKGVEE